MNSRRWSRRAALVLAMASAGTVLCAPAARARTVDVGGLAFVVPDTVEAVAPSTALGQDWQWQGLAAGTVAALPATVVLARADLPGNDAQEIVALVTASAVGGLLPGLELSRIRTRAMPGGGDQTRVDLRYATTTPTPTRPTQALHGTLLIAVGRPAGAGLLAVVGNDQLTAGTIDAVLDSARWLR